MPTHGIVGRLTQKSDGTLGFSGVYLHWDAYPTGIGGTLWNLYRGPFENNAEHLASFLADEHPGGFSSIGSNPFVLKMVEDQSDTGHGNYSCYCHGRTGEPDEKLTDETADPAAHEWVYAVAPNRLVVFAGDVAAGFEVVGDYPLSGPEPDWHKLESDAGYVDETSLAN